MPRVLGQQVAVGVHRFGREPGGLERGQPLIHQRLCDDRDRRRRRISDALADGEVQVVDVFGELLFERVRHHLLQLGAGLDGDLGLREQHIGARHEHAHATPACAHRGQRRAGRFAGRRSCCRANPR